MIEFEVSGDMIFTDRGEDVMKELEMNAITRLRVRVLYSRHLLGQESELARKSPVEKVVEFFSQHKALKKQTKMIAENKIDGEMLLKASQEAVIELGISAIGWSVIEKHFKDFVMGGK